ncbi:class C sortase [Allocoprobacillus halotolerans]|uniref:Class C sortase n=1 Tax=Allocoprobacillus halotolerans TaxID=2944914 RepID=A0ABY5I346_9FIRM|nr:class C sortase [Allocoprobacillus halotolerans]UTY38566.1 class C sortase [Allocoprobacillus halotolerans]
MSRKKRIFDGIRIIALLFFVGVLLYPTVSDYLSRIHSSKVIQSYEKSIVGLDQETKNKMLQEAQAYNSSLIGKEELYDPFMSIEKVDKYYMSLLNSNGDGVMGYIQIPRIDVKLPIYHTTSDKVLQKGVGHLQGTSLPVGGKSTHVALSGHRGLPSSSLFTDLDLLEIGDIFYMEVLGNTSAYKIDQIKIVLPTETKDLEIVDGKDYVTLITCTPYSVNTHRLLVRGTRIDYQKAIKEQVNEVNNGIHIPFEIQILLIGFTVLALIFLLWKVRRKKHEVVSK